VNLICFRRFFAIQTRSIIAVVLLALSSATGVQADTLYESATLGPTGTAPGGLEVSSPQFVGSRFFVSGTPTTTRVGGHLYETQFQPLGNHQIFGALVALAGPTDVPDSFDLSTPDVLGSTLLTLQPLSNDVSAPLQVSLTPGWYAVIFGSGQFGATGHGAFTYNNTPVGNPDNFSRLGDQYLSEADAMRMFVEAVPEPTGAMLAVTCLAVLVARARRS
jgi:hypothetical protein